MPQCGMAAGASTTPPRASAPLDEREEIRFFLPGPAYVPADVRLAMAAPVVGHRSPEFKALYASLAQRLPAVCRTRGEVLTATGSSTLVMEAAVRSTVRGAVLNLTGGAFSERWHAVCRSLGLDADRVSVPWGEALDPDLVARALARRRYDAVTVVHSETSTGVLNPLPEIARAVREGSDALLLVDTVSSLGGAPVETDAWGLDVVLAGVQKALACPPGVVLFTLSERAARAAEGVEHRGFFTDLLRYRGSHRERGGTITTPAVPVFYALDRQVDRVLAEGLPRRWERHAALRRRTGEWATERGLSYASAPGVGSPTVSCLKPPPGVSAPALVARLAEAGYTLGPGYGQWKAATFRIGHMGEVQPNDLEGLLAALDTALAEAAA